MKKSTRILLGIVTIWPVVYMLLFFLTIFSFIIFIPFAQTGGNRNAQSIDLIQLEQKIKNGEVRLLTIRGHKITATDRVGGQEFDVYVTNEQTRAEIINMKILWTVLICMVGIGAMPVYWYLNIWREPAAVTPPLPPP